MLANRRVARRVFDFFIFSSLYIASCAVLMAHQTNQLFHLDYNRKAYFLFVFFSTICSYNFHWYLTPNIKTEAIRVNWTHQHKTMHFILFLTGMIGSAWFYFYFFEHWFWMGGAGVLTFLYSAPKLPLKPFWWLRKIAVGKTLFLAFVWMYVTTFLPLIFGAKAWEGPSMIFCVSRFTLIYAICIIFDYRDRPNDKQDGIRSLITYLNERGIDRLFYGTLLLFGFSTVALYFFNFTMPIILLLLSPGLITLAIYRQAKRNFSDYLYYFVLDGLMMFSAIFTSFISI